MSRLIYFVLLIEIFTSITLSAAPPPPEKKAPSPETTYLANQMSPAKLDLPRNGSIAAELGYQKYVENLAKIIYYWAYPFVNIYQRTSQWQQMKEPGVLLGLIPAAPMNQIGYVNQYLPNSQKWIVSSNHDTIYGSGFMDLSKTAVVLQVPTDVPSKHYWTIQITDAYSNVIHQLGSRSETKGGKYLLIGPDWTGDMPSDLVSVLRVPTEISWVMPRVFMAKTQESQKNAIHILRQIGTYPLNMNKPEFKQFDVTAIAENVIYPQGINPQEIEENPDKFRPQWVNPKTFWKILKRAILLNPHAGKNDEAMLDQAKMLITLYEANPNYQPILDRAALEADTEIKAGAKYQFVGVDAGNGWQKQNNAGNWGSDWFGRAQASLIYMMVNNHDEAVYYIRATDSENEFLNGKNRYTITFPKGSLPPVDKEHGGFWSLTLYDSHYFMLSNPPNKRNNIGTVHLESNELEFNSDGSLTLYLAQKEPKKTIANTNWLPTPNGNFNLMMRIYAPLKPILNDRYQLPDVKKS